MATAMHDDVASFAFLLGTWQGTGAGSYPTIEPFEYREELAFEHVGDAFLLYRQESWSPSDEPIHFEGGFLRPGGTPGSVELCLAHPIGVTEVAHGTIDGTSLDLTADDGAIGRSRTGLEVTGVRRQYRVDGDQMSYRLDLATDTTPMTLHLEATLRRVT